MYNLVYVFSDTFFKPPICDFCLMYFNYVLSRITFIILTYLISFHTVIFWDGQLVKSYCQLQKWKYFDIEGKKIPWMGKHDQFSQWHFNVLSARSEVIQPSVQLIWEGMLLMCTYVITTFHFPGTNCHQIYFFLTINFLFHKIMNNLRKVCRCYKWIVVWDRS